MRLNNKIYTINDPQRAHNKKYNNIDYFLCWAYAAISIINASLGINSLNMNIFEIKDETVIFNLQGIETILLLIINFIILFRLNTKLVILRKDIEQQIRIEEKIEENSIIKINIPAIDKRMQCIFYSYIIEVVIFAMNIIYQKKVETSLSTLVFIPIVLTLYNDMVDNEKNKCMAEEKITFEYPIIQKEKKQ